MTLEAPWTMETGAKVEYLITLICVEALRQCDSLSADVEITDPLTMEYFIMGLALYFPPVYLL